MPNEPEGSWPSNFAPTEPSQPLPAPKFAECTQALDGFGISFYGWPLDNLWAVVMDGGGHLRPIPFAAKGRLPDALQVQLSAHAMKGHPRALEAEHLYLFALEVLENLADMPGFNDPVALCGRLFGPFPTRHDRAGEPRVCRGRFCVSRAHVLEGLVRGEPFVFHGAGTEAHGEPLGSSYHLMLPAGLPEAQPGQAQVVLAYPSPVAMRAAADTTALAAALAYDVLAKIQDDMRRAQVCGAFPDLILPVPSRRNLEWRLKTRGYEIRGDYAYAPNTKPANSWLGRLFEGLARDRKELPPEAALPEFLRLARIVLESLTGWPTMQAHALRKQCRVLEAAWPPDGLGGLTRIQNADDVVVKQGEIVLRCKGQKGANAVFRLPPEFYPYDGDFSTPLEISVEWFDDEGGGQICYVPGWKEEYKILGTYALSGSKTWKTATYLIPDARSDGKLWGGDVGVYFHYQGRKPLRIRRTQVRAVRPDRLDAAKGRCQGNLDRVGGLDLSKEVIHWDIGVTDALPFSGWAIDLGQGTAQGDVVLILESENGQWPFGASQRLDRPDIVLQHGGAYAMAGYSGILCAKGLPTGLYKIFLRIVISGNYVQRELWYRLNLVAGNAAAASQTSDETATAEPASPIPAVAAPSKIEPKPATKGPLQTAYHDPDFRHAWLKDPEDIAKFLSEQGFTVLDADALADWMNEHVGAGAVGSVCVFTQDVAPDTVLEVKSRDCLFRKYLDAGGRIVWPGDVPLYYRGTLGKKVEEWGGEGQAAVLDLPPSWADLKPKPVVTEFGKECGVTVVGSTERCQAVADVTVALTTVRKKFAESWLKNFCPQFPLSGFWRLHVGAFPGKDAEANSMLVRVAKHKLEIPK